MVIHSKEHSRKVYLFMFLMVSTFENQDLLTKECSKGYLGMARAYGQKEAKKMKHMRENINLIENVAMGSTNGHLEIHIKGSTFKMGEAGLVKCHEKMVLHIKASGLKVYKMAKD